MPTLYPKAEYRPLGPQTQPKLTEHRCIIFHTMGGYLQGTDGMFKRNGYVGDESHFGVGGQYDGPSLDGSVWQWQDLDYTADAQYAGNMYGISIETSDGGHSGVQWDKSQLNSLIFLTTWLCKKYNIPAKLMVNVTDKGIGYHSLFRTEWNRDGHLCPGVARVTQLVNTVIPEVARRLKGSNKLRVVRRPSDNKCYSQWDDGHLVWIPDGTDLQVELDFCGQKDPVNLSPSYINSFPGH